MGVIERIESIVKSNLNDLLDRTGNPEKVLGQLILDMESELSEVRNQLADAIREGKRLQMLHNENRQLAEKWQKKAVLAVQHGKDDLAREAILRKRSAVTLAEEYSQECELHDDVVASLKSAMAALEAKFSEAKRKKDDIIARKRQADASRLLGRDAMFEASSTFERLENKVMSLDAEAEALAEGSDDDSDATQREIELEAELAKLKSKMKNEKS